MRLDGGDVRRVIGRQYGLLLRVDSRAQLLGSWLAAPPGGRPVWVRGPSLNSRGSPAPGPAAKHVLRSCQLQRQRWLDTLCALDRV